ncbi:MAG: ATP-binding protein [Candidatus Methanogaster sp.]|uniref:ATP-binding protein n=1 Tax=Candidatus Methanogaster sp. TaxID=3386292 RepID=A0AC61L7U8_9EURY|nr:MAG: ATP-binding protein [ANME-2 cluster archaeon]
MMEVSFYDREQETKEIMDTLRMKPRLITFIYGPINSGKTELITHLIEELPEDYIPFYVNLRGRFITGYEDFLNVLFEIDEGGMIDNVSEYATSILKDLKIVSGIPIPVNLFEQIFERKDKSKDVFKYIEHFFIEISKKRVPVLVIDELQVIGDLKIDGLLVYKLFNFFVRLTKELHLAHVFVVTSDSLFIEQVYSEAMLEERCKYLPIDDFDYETTIAFLDHYGFDMHEREIAWQYVGGKPVSLVRLIDEKASEKKIEDVAGSMLTLRTGEIETMLKRVNELGGGIIIEDIKYSVSYEKLVEALKSFATCEAIGMNEVDEISKTFLVKKNVLFVDPLTKMIKPQSQLNLLAVREVTGIV